MKLGLITVLFKSDEMLPGFFQSIAMQDYSNHILYLVDNSPTEITKQKITTLAGEYGISHYRHIECNGNIGVAAANNVGIKAALQDGCEDMIILNNDIEFNNRALFSSLVATAANSGAAVIAPKIYFFGSNKIWYAGSDFIKWNCNIKHTGEFEEDNGQYHSINTEYAPTCFVYVKKHIFLQVGLMDETYFVYVDDLDFMYRLRLKGHTIWYENKLSIQHKISQSTGGKFSKFSLFYAVRNRIFFARKFFSFAHVAVVALYVFASHGYHLILKEKKASLFTTLCKAIYHGFALKPIKAV